MSVETGHGALVQDCPARGGGFDPGKNSRPRRLGSQRCRDTIRIRARFTTRRIPGLVQHESCDGCCVTQLSELALSAIRKELLNRETDVLRDLPQESRRNIAPLMHRNRGRATIGMTILNVRSSLSDR
jgi:hypothetical protein